jgi:hypothetical protein
VWATVDRRWQRAPALEVDRVVRLVVPRGLGADLGSPVELAALADADPAGDVFIPLVEHDQGTRHLGDVFQHRHALRLGHPSVVHEPWEIMLAEDRGPHDLAPALDHRELLHSRQFLKTRQAGVGEVDALLEPTAQSSGWTA